MFQAFSASSTYVRKDGDFITGGTGYIGSDLVNISGLSTNMSFGILDDVEYWYKHLPVDGLLGLYLCLSENNIASAVEQIVGELERPVFTFGSEKSVYCEDNSGYVPLLNDGLPDDPDSFTYRFYLKSAFANAEDSVKIDLVAMLSPDSDYIYCDLDFQNILINATGAVHNSTTCNYHVDCSAIYLSKVTLNIGENGNTSVVMTGADYINMM
uniref:Peptidase A1 domain-containing protein n=1 Tax=Ditylenchus dipsaci TaxID=166011 RepID=A0A915ERL5_9BILA